MDTHPFYLAEVANAVSQLYRKSHKEITTIFFHDLSKATKSDDLVYLVDINIGKPDHPRRKEIIMHPLEAEVVSKPDISLKQLSQLLVHKLKVVESNILKTDTSKIVMTSPEVSVSYLFDKNKHHWVVFFRVGQF